MLVSGCNCAGVLKEEDEEASNPMAGLVGYTA